MIFLFVFVDCAAASPDIGPAALPVDLLPPQAASGLVEFKMRLLNFPCRQLTSLERQSQPFQACLKGN
jgi:hypothetical protein